MEILPEHLAESVKKGTDGIPWRIDEQPDKDLIRVRIVFGRDFVGAKPGDWFEYNLLVKKYEILLGIKDFYKKYLDA